MTEKEKAPLCSKGNSQGLHHKDNISFQHPQRQRMYEMFLSGGQFSNVQFSEILHVPDPRSHIRYIRGAGVPISDYWVKSKFSKHKVYFLHTEKGRNV